MWVNNKFHLTNRFIYVKTESPKPKRTKPMAVYFYDAPFTCDICANDLGNVMYDAKIHGMFGCVCPECFASHGGKLGVGHGQKYQKDENGYLLVAGWEWNEQGNFIPHLLDYIIMLFLMALYDSLIRNDNQSIQSVIAL